jgi:hypothetical protein
VRRLVASLICVVLMLAEASVASAASKTLELPFGGPPPRVTCDSTGKVCHTAKHRRMAQALEHARHRARLVALAAELASATPPPQVDAAQPNTRQWGGGSDRQGKQQAGSRSQSASNGGHRDGSRGGDSNSRGSRGDGSSSAGSGRSGSTSASAR